MFKFITQIFGNKSERDIKIIYPIVDQINAEYAKLSSVSNDELRGKTEIFKATIREHLKNIDSQIESLKGSVNDNAEMADDEKESIYNQVDKLVEERDKEIETVLNTILPEAFAVVRETARRFKENKTLEVTATQMDRDLAAKKDHITIDGDKAIWQNNWLAAGIRVIWDMVHYDVQLIGGIVLHHGKISEMATGEGKTLVSTLPAYLNALVDAGVHIVTVNDYLAKRDSEWMGPIHEFLGITVDCIDKYPPHSEDRIKAYNAGITYGTNNEFGFDYLRDNMSRQEHDLVQRKHHYAMVDEVDSVLIDDARTPLIISGPVPKGDEQEFQGLKPRIVRLMEVQKKVANENLIKAKKLIEEGKNGAEEGDGGLPLLRAHRALPKNKALIKFLSEGYNTTLQKTENVYLSEQQKRMPEVDKELYFVIDEKHNSVDLTEKGIELITGAGEDPNFFIIPDVGSEVAKMENSPLSADEKVAMKDQLMQDFAIKSERIHSVQQLLKAYALFEMDIDYLVVDGKVKIVDENTGRVLEGRRYSDGLHQAIEAKENVKVEAATQTFATVTLQNYFRMYHKLAGMTGTAETEAGELWNIYKLDVVVIPTNRKMVRDDREDLVYRTKREKYNAIIDHIIELQNAGRPILVGTTSVEVSELLSRILKQKNIRHNVLNAKQHQREAEIVAEAGTPGTVTIATNMAGRGTDIKLTPETRAAGGLAIIGSERHESRRVDRQLRGRSGRQGDPGTSQFFVSMEDDLMRLFISDGTARLMDRLGYKEGEVIQHKWITKSIERAQKKVEENNFGTRKRLLEYDDVMNSQREVIYKKRRHALYGERLSIDIDNMIYDLCAEVIETNHANLDYENFQLDVLRFFAMEPQINEQEYLSSKSQSLTEKLYPHAKEIYKRKSDFILKMALPIFERTFKERGETVKNIAVPFSDGKKTISVLTNLEKALTTNGKELIRAFEKGISLAIIDENWMHHLREMDELKQSVQSAVYEQKDPLLIYKFEAFNMFKKMSSEVNKEICAFLYKGSIPVRKQEDVREAAAVQKTNLSNLKTSRPETVMTARPHAVNPGGGVQQQEQKKAEPVRVAKKVGRNDPCPCGSGKKYKNCHGKDEA